MNPWRKFNPDHNKGLSDYLIRLVAGRLWLKAPIGMALGVVAAVMPLSIKTAEESLRVRPSIAQFVIPVMNQ